MELGNIFRRRETIVPKDKSDVEKRAERVKEAREIIQYLKEFDREYYMSRQVGDNLEDEALRVFKIRYHVLRALIDKNKLSETEVGLTAQNIADFESISNLTS